uniref:DUF2201 family putative metallopeptidase n=1 Tax=Desertifilum tharense IPPAS B-1220 TaxID=1781255 RepID=A0ACD5GRN3_9CYAN
MSLTADIEKTISASVLRVRMRCPFFATLALFTNFHTTHTHPTAATDGKNIYFNPEFVRSLSSPQVDGVLLHEVLHAALLHVVRRGTREPLLWNIAADIVVNGAIAEQKCFELPEGTIRDPELEHLSVEEVYEILLPTPNAMFSMKALVTYSISPLAIASASLAARCLKPIGAMPSRGRSRSLVLANRVTSPQACGENSEASPKPNSTGVPISGAIW